MPKDNKTMRKNNSERNKSSSAHYERSSDNPYMQDIPIAPGFNEYPQLLKEAIGADNEELFNARLKTFASGLPVVGPMVEAYDRAQQLEDLYRRTGKLPAYASISGVGYGGVADVASNAAKTIGRVAAGTNDLYQFYAGEPDQFRSMMNGAYQ